MNFQSQSYPRVPPRSAPTGHRPPPPPPPPLPLRALPWKGLFVMYSIMKRGNKRRNERKKSWNYRNKERKKDGKSEEIKPERKGDKNQGRSYGGWPGGGGAGAPHKLSVPPPRCPPPPEKNHAYIFFNLPISRVCKYYCSPQKSCLCMF